MERTGYRLAETALVPLETPPWLAEALQPWRAAQVLAWPNGGVAILMASSRARVLVLVEWRDGEPSIGLLDPQTPRRPARALVHALRERLRGVPELASWLSLARRLRDVFARQVSLGLEADAIRTLWATWPGRIREPSLEVTPLPDVAAGIRLDRAARAALVHHRFARGDFLAALAAWETLGELPGDAGFVETHVHALALGMLGHRHEALEHLSRVETAPLEPEPLRAIAHLRELLLDQAGAAKTWARVVEETGGTWDRLQLARARGEDADRLCSPPVLLEAQRETALARTLALVLEETGAYDGALRVIEATLDAAEGEERLDLARRGARLHAWRLDAAKARTCLAMLDPRDARRLEIEGALEVLAGRPIEALRRLEAVENRPEALLWRAHAHLLLGEAERAQACVQEAIMAEHSLSAFLLQALVMARMEPKALRRGLRSPTFLEALVDDVLPGLVGATRVDAARADPARFATLVVELLDAMGGNRSATPTWCRTDGAGNRRLERIDVRATGRQASVDALVRLRTEDPASVSAHLAAVAQTYPRSPHPFTYAGELALWLGRHAEALEAFDRADGRAPTRWSFIGRAAVHDLLGDPEEAERWSRRGVARFGSLPSATTHVYRGERLRRDGSLDAARTELELALRHRPRRIGARMNLALVLRALGDTPGWSRELARLETEAPAFLWEAGARPDHPVEPETLEAALRLMAGNRSSVLHTLMDDRGNVRVIPAPLPLRSHARLTLHLARLPFALALRDLAIAASTEAQVTPGAAAVER